MVDRLRLRKGTLCYDVYVAFHSGAYSGSDRQKAKAFLHHIHYGTWNTEEADKEVAERRKLQDGTYKPTK